MDKEDILVNGDGKYLSVSVDNGTSGDGMMTDSVDVTDQPTI